MEGISLVRLFVTQSEGLVEPRNDVISYVVAQAVQLLLALLTAIALASCLSRVDQLSCCCCCFLCRFLCLCFIIKYDLIAIY